MPLAIGTRLGPYEILAPLGAGGMGEVYRARDTRLSREVALKILTGEAARDAVRLRRFQTEAQASAALSHPNIVSIYDVGEEGGIPYIVSELVEGTTLSAALARGPFPARRLLDLAVGMAEGLSAAHAQGIVHRDLKPANVLLTAGGVPKIADFGLAKYFRPSSDSEGSQLTTLPDERTSEGTILGTVCYMSPEQAKGEPADFRSDQFSLGSVLYEMATGKKAFQRSSLVQTLAAIVQEEPDPVARLTPTAPAPLRWIIDRCLAKEPERRYDSTRDLARDLDGLRNHLSEAGGSHRVVPSGRRKRPLRLREAIAWGLAGLFLFALLLIPRVGRGPDAAPRRIEASILPPAGSLFDPSGGLAISPDGTRIVFRGAEKLFVRDLGQGTARPLPGTDGGRYPFWSPDGHTIGFMATGLLKKIDLDGAQPVVLSELPQQHGRGASWSAAGILFAPESSGPLRLLPAQGGPPRPVTRLEKPGDSHRWPAFLPDGRHFIYLAISSHPGRRDQFLITVGSLDASDTKPLFHAKSSVLYAKPGYLLFAADERRLMAQPFDSRSLKLTGPALPITERVCVTAQLWSAAFSVSDTGVLAYHGGLSEIPSRLAWFDRAGRELARVGASGEHWHSRLSPDGKRLAVTTGDETGQADIWIRELERGTASRLTFDPADDFGPAWSPDGRTIAFSSYRKGFSDLYLQPIAGAAVEEPIFVSRDEKWQSEWSPDGRTLLFAWNDQTKNQDVWELPLDGQRRPRPLVRSPFQETSPRFGPDGRYFAYTSNESGSTQIYVQRFPPSGERWQVSSGGGTSPVWPRAGHELFYIENGRRLMSAEVGLHPAFRVGASRLLFEAEGLIAWDISADGQRLLLLILDREAPPHPLTVVWNGLPR